MVIADEDALVSLYASKGASGLKPCLLCKNVFDGKNPTNIPSVDPSGVAVSHICRDFEKLKFHTTASVFGIFDRLAAAKSSMTNADFKEVQALLGWNYSPDGLMWHPVCRSLADPSRFACYDWMHCFFVNGVWNVHAGEFLIVLKRNGLSFASINDYMKQWSWPKWVSGNTGQDVFSEKRIRSNWEAKVFKATASECLSVFPVLSNFMAAFIGGANADMHSHAQCFLQLSNVVDIILKSGRGDCRPDELQDATSKYLAAFHALFGAERMTPKFHYIMHCLVFLRNWRHLQNCFVHERKHKLPKKFANEVRNVHSNWEAGVLRESTCHHITALTSGRHHFETEASLIDAHQAGKSFRALLHRELSMPLPAAFATARVARANQWECCAVGDFVSAQSGDNVVFGFVRFHISGNMFGADRTLSCINRLALVSEHPRCRKFRRGEDQILLFTEDIKHCMIHGGSGDIVTALKPPFEL